ncbi:MAG: NfeD family protein [Acetobacteraceae bacterium]|nr:NfeD family protein [Acetobacteraceae bacterium]
MQWVFLVLALSAALAELHTGTFYLAAVAAVSLATWVLGFWLPEEPLIFVFVGGCVVAVALVWFYHRHLPHGRVLADFDTGQEATVAAVLPGGRLTVTYRGTRWDAVLDGGPPPPVGTVLRITRKTGSVLHVAARSVPHRSVQETS